MKVLLVNTSDNAGGAAVAANRLMEALRKNGVEASMLVRDRGTDNPCVHKVRGPWWKRMLDSLTPQGSWCKAVERVMLLPYTGYSWKRAWGIDSNILGTDITRTKEFREADVIHLHWVNQGMLSLKDLEKILKSGKRVVWTMHDAWLSTSLCHLTLGCRNFTHNCEDCHLVSSQGYVDKVWRKKRELYTKHHIEFTTCSNWLRNEALSSSLMHDQSVTAIPNPIDTSIFFPQDKIQARKELGLPLEKKLILFVAQYINNPNKGASYLVDAIKEDPTIGIVVIGNNGGELKGLLPNTEVFDLGYQRDAKKIAKIYNAADCFVLPSLSENLPNTIMEAMACGVPSVGFEIGGIPEMIDDERNGKVCEPRNAVVLKAGIDYCLASENHRRLSDECLRKVESTYSQKAVAERFKQIYFAVT